MTRDVGLEGAARCRPPCRLRRPPRPRARTCAGSARPNRRRPCCRRRRARAGRSPARVAPRPAPRLAGDRRLAAAAGSVIANSQPLPAPVAARSDRAAVRGDDLVRDVEPDAQPFGACASRAASAAEELEQHRHLVLRDADADVAHAHHDRTVPRTRPSTSMREPSGEYLLALTRRLVTACSNRALSSIAVNGPFSAASTTACRRAYMSARVVSIAPSTARPTSTRPSSSRPCATGSRGRGAPRAASQASRPGARWRWPRSRTPARAPAFGSRARSCEWRGLDCAARARGSRGNCPSRGPLARSPPVAARGARWRRAARSCASRRAARARGAPPRAPPRRRAAGATSRSSAAFAASSCAMLGSASAFGISMKSRIAVGYGSRGRDRLHRARDPVRRVPERPHFHPVRRAARDDEQAEQQEHPVERNVGTRSG